MSTPLVGATRRLKRSVLFSWRRVRFLSISRRRASICSADIVVLLDIVRGKGVVCRGARLLMREEADKFKFKFGLNTRPRNAQRNWYNEPETREASGTAVTDAFA